MKSKIRKQIEIILNNGDHTYYVDKRANGNFRMKICCSKPATKLQIEKLLKLPNVIKVGFAENKNKRRIYPTAKGITIHFNKRPSEIEV